MLIALFFISIPVRLLPVRHEHENSDEQLTELGIHFHPTGAKKITIMTSQNSKKIACTAV